MTPTTMQRKESRYGRRTKRRWGFCHRLRLASGVFLLVGSVWLLVGV